MGKDKRVALYVRVSTDGQSVENQKRELEAAAKGHQLRPLLLCDRSPKRNAVTGSDESVAGRAAQSVRGLNPAPQSGPWSNKRGPCCTSAHSLMG